MPRVSATLSASTALPARIFSPRRHNGSAVDILATTGRLGAGGYISVMLRTVTLVSRVFFNTRLFERID